MNIIIIVVSLLIKKPKSDPEQAASKKPEHENLIKIRCRTKCLKSYEDQF